MPSRTPVRFALIRSAAAAGLALGVANCAGILGGRPAPPSNPLEAGILRAGQAPIVGLPDVFADDTLLGKRVRVLGWCAEAPGLLAGRRSGAWFLGTPDTTIEVRGLVPRNCGPAELRQTLVLVFAQVVRAKPNSAERLLLRLPD